ncbi:hypothetical protein CKO31_19845 [Thiohalocapsa halophila]|uniref:Uncharacterized protein n=1 Tax=Thiohalocapsa halophila TaxID=69359 RepID=A0ABS1CLZ2_9GAMM|nr:hypothetical protein [Thiohalocapsa halophila]MBK1632962.1 hypothetical protein [Thiohalocapsa halophila]
MTDPLCTKLDPARFPNMSEQLATIIGFVLGEALTEPAIAELHLTPDGGVLAVPVTAAGERGQAAFIGPAADLQANLSRFVMAAGLDADEWAECVRVVREHSRLDLSAVERVR